jgi:hypothetical protein
MTGERTGPGSGSPAHRAERFRIVPPTFLPVGWVVARRGSLRGTAPALSFPHLLRLSLSPTPSPSQTFPFLNVPPRLMYADAEFGSCTPFSEHFLLPLVAVEPEFGLHRRLCPETALSRPNSDYPKSVVITGA